MLIRIRHTNNQVLTKPLHQTTKMSQAYISTITFNCEPPWTNQFINIGWTVDRWVVGAAEYWIILQLFNCVSWVCDDSFCGIAICLERVVSIKKNILNISCGIFAESYSVICCWRVPDQTGRCGDTWEKLMFSSESLLGWWYTKPDLKASLNARWRCNGSYWKYELLFHCVGKIIMMTSWHHIS